MSQIAISKESLRSQIVTSSDWDSNLESQDLQNMDEKKNTSLETAIVTLDQVERRIYTIRGDKVMLDSELAELYGVTTF